MKTAKNKLVIAVSLFAASLMHSAVTHATVTYLGSASLTGSDLSGLTDTLENGQAHNLLGGFGSAITYAGGNNYIVTPDRGPNAVAYNSAVDDTTSYIERFHELSINVTANAASSTGYSVSAALNKTTLLSNATPLYGAATASNPNKTYFTGLSSGFNPSTTSADSNNMRLDAEGVRVSNDGKSVYISDEYGPYIYQFDRATGQRIGSIALPPAFDITNQSAMGNTEITNNTSGRVANKGMEGLAISPDGKTLYGIMQSPLLQDNALDASQKKKGTDLRLVKIDLATGTIQQFVYQLASKSNIVSEIIAINDHQFIIDERDGNGGATSVKNIYSIDLTGATDVSSIASLPATGLPAGVVAVTKSGNPLLNISAVLGANTPEKIEGLAFGPDLADGRHLLLVTNDNDFVAGTANNIYAFAIDSADLVGFQPQQISSVPLPAAAWLMGSALFGLAGLRRRNKSVK